MTQTDVSKSKGPKPRKLMLIRYGRMGLLGWFEHNESVIPKTPTRVIIKTTRGMELGEVVGPFSYRSGQFRNSPEQVTAYYNSADPKDFPIVEGGSFVRFATEEDLREAEHLDASAQEEARTCARFVREMNLPMKIIEAEHLFGGERIILYFSSNGRVDFRDLVRRLAKEYQTRIELRQIGSRDEARLISDFESCGQECCCRRFLKILDPVNMRMAKLQKATLDPSKISGHCGRLKCCLRYEDEIYRILKEQMPRKNSWVQTPRGPGRIFDAQILTQQVVVQLSENERESFAARDVSPLAGPPEGVTWHLFKPAIPARPGESAGPNDSAAPGGRPSGRDRNRQGQRCDRLNRPRRPDRNEWGNGNAPPSAQLRNQPIADTDSPNHESPQGIADTESTTPTGEEEMPMQGFAVEDRDLTQQNDGPVSDDAADAPDTKDQP